MTLSQTLETERLLLRPWAPDDREPFARLNGDPIAMEFLARPLTRAESDGYIDVINAHFAQHGFGMWAVERRGEGAFVGLVGLRHVPYDLPCCPAVEVAWRLLPEYWGRGYAPEAARASLRFGFEHLNLREIVAFTIPANLKSQRVMQKIGMTRDPAEDFEHPSLPEGHPKRRHVLYRIRAEEWSREG